MTRLVVGLGNPGKEYEKTRHNIGFMVIDDYVKSKGASFDKQKFSGVYTEIIQNGTKTIYLKPQKYMNLSGEVVSDFVNYFDISLTDILIISDDLNLEIGKIRLRSKGSSGGHNGLKNIELHLHSNEYKRLRIGISSNKNIDMKDFVLGKFSKENLQILEDNFSKTRDIIDNIFDSSIENLMSKYN